MNQKITRRPNTERTAETKAKIFHAAEQCIIELGHAQASNKEICRRADVSNGSLLHHFGTRDNLLALTLEQLYERLRRQFIEEVKRESAGGDSLDRVVDSLYAIFKASEFKVIFEISLAAANDSDLRDRVVPIISNFSDAVDVTIAEILPDASSSPNFREVLDVLFSTLSGFGIECATSASSNTVHTEKSLKILKEMLRWALGSYKK